MKKIKLEDFLVQYKLYSSFILGNVGGHCSISFMHKYETKVNLLFLLLGPFIYK